VPFSASKVQLRSFRSIECRRLEQPVRAWKADFSGLGAIATHPVAPVGEPILINRREEVEVLRRVCVRGEVMALVSWCDSLFLVNEDDLETRTVQEQEPLP
jgi:hypothetical protein